MSLSKSLKPLDDDLTPHASDNEEEETTNPEIEIIEEVGELLESNNNIIEPSRDHALHTDEKEAEQGPTEEELIEDALEIMMKQVTISRDHAIRFIKENNYDPVSAILAYLDYKPEKETNTYFTTMVNPYELINELVKLSDNLTYKKYNQTTIIDGQTQTYVCVLINDTGLRKFKKYTSITNLAKLYVSSSNTELLKFKIGVEYYGILYTPENITTEPKTVNKELTVILRNFELITAEQFYSGDALFINNCFLD